jgi:Putative amidoligase enzyme
MIRTDLTVGLELEWADVDRRIEIPETLGSWNHADNSIVNSDGHANDPKGVYPFGGEINTRPTSTAGEQADIVRRLAEILTPTINYRCNLHVHIGIPGLADDLIMLKQVASYLRSIEPFVYSVIEPIPKPRRSDYESDEAYKGARKRESRRYVSHQKSLDDARYEAMMKATTPTEFRHEHFYAQADGSKNFRSVPRTGMNLRSLWKHGTIEFRHFPGTDNPVEIESAASWCLAVIDAALNSLTPPDEIYASRVWAFPRFRRYRHTLELGYQSTKFPKGT